MKRELPIEVTSQERDWGKNLADASGSDCPPASDLILFVESKASKPAEDVVMLHLGHCRSCRKVILELRAAESAKKKLFPFAGLSSWSRTAFGGALAGLVLIAAGASYWQLSGHVTKSGSKGLVAKQEEPGLKVTIAAGELKYKPAKPLRSKERQDLVAMNSESGSSESGVRAMKLCLVLGASHVYKVDPTDAHRDQRKQIEQAYADGVASKRDKYSLTFKSGPARRSEEVRLKRELEELAAERERRLGEIYPTADELKVKHPELEVENCGPCPVVQFSAREDGVPDPNEDFVVVEPWPGYKPGTSAYGWTYGRHYRPDDFQDQYQRWHASHVGTGHPVFYGLQGRSGPVAADEIRRTRTGSYHIHLTDPLGGKSFARTASPEAAQRPSVATQSRYSAPHSADFGRSGEPSKYSHSLDGRHEESFSTVSPRTAPVEQTSEPSRYSHTLSGSHYPPKRSSNEADSAPAPRSKYLRGQSGGRPPLP